ncbi:hypothetical protein AZI86_16175 [Bdellovibrio bacteriovorus]|uniref:Thioredoxin-like fold domain-containing protein n=1 Tax=Bdellovibrio bacteriovorus TaxID=959 RepID=A0A150WGR0_BDEBC|nr:hypothetical protein [Bdellovibrio bacteriovorus]KYG62373.1 hypothetical protein AZI86_16175 [Bdellovibrio bacteriovorus]
MKATCITFLVFTLVSLSSHARTNYLFQSLNDLDKYIVTPRDLKGTALIISIPEPCNSCESLKPFLNDYIADENRPRAELIIAVGAPLWRKAKDMIDKATWLTATEKQMTYNDPNARFRKTVGGNDIRVVLMERDGSVKKSASFDIKTRYKDFVAQGDK